MTTDLPEFREPTRKGCVLLVSAHNPQVLVSRVEEIIDKARLALELKERYITFAASRSWNNVAEHFCSLYKELLQR